MSTFDIHIKAIRSGEVTKTNVIGLRKAINADERRRLRYSVSSTAPKAMTDDQWEQIMQDLADIKPRVIGELHDSGMKLLQDRRYRRQLKPVADIVADLVGFRLVGFDINGTHSTPVYRAYDSAGRSFPYSCRSWQSGGNGPTLENPNYW